ncbi:hypothetical protein QCA50_014358 [Cerrena zonata]|uniref:O-fucosyltransferase family protein n=1 Tax=Cerrena zonata TaxID=2478898 RepID=A0AAW0FNJ1_9APHY
MLRSRPTRQAEASIWTREFSPALPTITKTPSQASLDIAWKELEESPKRISLRRSYDELRSPRRRFKRILPLMLALACCVLLFWFLAPGLYASLKESHNFLPSPPPQVLEPTQDLIEITPSQAPTTSPSSKASLVHVQAEPRITDTRKVRWPPMVTAIPETRPDTNSLYSGVTASSIDAQFCGGISPCRILLPLWIGEQESRSRMHLVQVLQLARSLNRTLVLPNVGRSRIGACGRWEFEVYYDVGSFVGPKTEADEGLVRKVMLMDDFRTWLEMRPTEPSGQLLFVDEKTDVDEDASKDKISPNSTEALSVYVDKTSLDVEDSRLRKVRCLPTKYRQLELETFAPMTVHIPPVDSFGGQFLADALAQDEIIRHSVLQGSLLDPIPEVLVLHWDTRHFPFPNLLDPEAMNLDYSSKLYSLARKLMQPPYLAIHWRMETVSPSLLPDCAEALVDTLTTLLSDPNLASGIQTIWFASDFPWPVSSSAADILNSNLEGDQTQGSMQIASSARRSNTFRSVSHEHVEAIGIFTSAFRKGGVLENWRLTGVTEELERVRREMEKEGKGYVLEEDDDEGVLLEDSGVLGILDKLVAMDSALFVSGAKRCGRVSSFTKQITDYRAKQKEANVPRNIVDIFG